MPDEAARREQLAAREQVLEDELVGAAAEAAQHVKGELRGGRVVGRQAE